MNFHTKTPRQARNQLQKMLSYNIFRVEAKFLNHFLVNIKQNFFRDKRGKHLIPPAVLTSALSTPWPTIFESRPTPFFELLAITFWIFEDENNEPYTHRIIRRTTATSYLRIIYNRHSNQ